MNRRGYLQHIVDRVGCDRGLTEIDEQDWAGYYRYLLEQVGEARWSRAYAAKLHRTARQFIEHLSTGGLIERPRNLDDRTMRFRVTAKAVEVFTPADVRRLLEATNGQLRLHIMLAVNCGMTQQDISDLRPSEVELEAGTIRRKRSKTGEHEGVPVVTYPLWTETLALLAQHASADPEHYLVTRTGQVWVHKGEQRHDSIGLAFHRLLYFLASLILQFYI